MFYKAVFLLACVFCAQAQADLFKCKSPSGSTSYQTNPCSTQQVKSKVAIEKSTVNKPAQDNFDKLITLQFSDERLSLMIQVIADFAGAKVDIPADLFDIHSRYVYIKVPCRDVLKDMAQKHHLNIWIENNTIKVRAK